MYCSNCGREASGKFCNNCGAPLTPPAPAPAPAPYTDPYAVPTPAPAPCADPCAAPAPEKPKKSRKGPIFGLLGFALLLVAAVLIAVPFIRERQITKVRQQCSASVDYLIGMQKEKPIRREQCAINGYCYLWENYTYDDDGTLTKIVGNTSLKKLSETVRNFYYDDDGVLKSSGDPGQTEYFYEYEFNRNNQIKRIKKYFDDETKLSQTSNFHYEDGRLVEIVTSYETEAALEKTVFTYDDKGKAAEYEEIWCSEDGTELYRRTYKFVYDDRGRLEEIVDNRDRTVYRYIYDDD